MSGDRVPISAEVRGRYRVWRAETARSSSRIEEVLYGERFGAATGDFTQRKGKGRERAAYASYRFGGRLSTHCGHSLARPLPARAPKRELSKSRIERRPFNRIN
jgi:hypothetical protein